MLESNDLVLTKIAGMFSNGVLQSLKLRAHLGVLLNEVIDGEEGNRVASADGKIVRGDRAGANQEISAEAVIDQYLLGDGNRARS